MPIASIIALLQVVVANLPGAISTTEQLVDLGKKFFAAANGTAPTAAEIAQLEAAIDADVTLALSPLPPAQPGDPDYVTPASS
jgi:hypothetical protein